MTIGENLDCSFYVRWYLLQPKRRFWFCEGRTFRICSFVYVFFLFCKHFQNCLRKRFLSIKFGKLLWLLVVQERTRKNKYTLAVVKPSYRSHHSESVILVAPPPSPSNRTVTPPMFAELYRFFSSLHRCRRSSGSMASSGYSSCPAAVALRRPLFSPFWAPPVLYGMLCAGGDDPTTGRQCVHQARYPFVAGNRRWGHCAPRVLGETSP